MIDIIRANKYCKDDISLIENYDKAKADVTQTWHCHHRREINEKLSVKELIDLNLYWKVSASDLIFLTQVEHASLHGLYGKYTNKGRQISEEQKEKTRNTWKIKYKNGYVNPRTGKSPFEYFTKEQLDNWKKERSQQTKEQLRLNHDIIEKRRQKLIGIKRTEEQIEHYKSSFTEERRKQLSESTKKWCEEHRDEISKRTSENNRKHKGENSYVYGRKWMNNGIEEKLLSKENTILYLNKGYKFGRL